MDWRILSTGDATEETSLNVAVATSVGVFNNVGADVSKKRRRRDETQPLRVSTNWQFL
jgi:hypothetical protein